MSIAFLLKALCTNLSFVIVAQSAIDVFAAAIAIVAHVF